jgi:hypothetical protein
MANRGRGNGVWSGSITTPGGGHFDAKLPYRIIPEGSFRPPIIRPEQKFPLSRLPRNVTSVYTQPGFADFSKKIMCPTKNPRPIKIDPLSIKVLPTKSYKYEKPQDTDKKCVTQVRDIAHLSADAGQRAYARGETMHSQVTGQIVVNPMNISGQTNYTGRNMDSGVTKKYTENYIQDHLNTSAGAGVVYYNQDSHHTKLDDKRYIQNPVRASGRTNKTRNEHHTPIAEIYDTKSNVKDSLNLSYDTYHSGITKDNNYIHDPLRLEKVLPRYSATANITNKNRYVRNEYEHIPEQERNMPLTSVRSGMTMNRRANQDNFAQEYNRLEGGMSRRS